MKTKAFGLFLFLLIFGKLPVLAQLNVVVQSGIIYIKGNNFSLQNPKKYSSIIDSLDNNLKGHPDDTTSLFERALLLDQLNNQLAKATSFTKDPISNLTVAKDMAEYAVALNMKDFRLKVLRAQIYKDLVYRYSVNETWKFTSQQISERKAKYIAYKKLANQYYDELALLDKRNAFDYQRLKVM